MSGLIGMSVVRHILIADPHVGILHVQPPVLGVVVEVEQLLIHYSVVDVQEVFNEREDRLVGLEELVKRADLIGQGLVATSAKYGSVVAKVLWFVAVEGDEGVVGFVGGIEFNPKLTHFLEYPNDKAGTFEGAEPLDERHTGRVPNPPGLIVDACPVIPLEIGCQLIELLPCHLRHLSECAELGLGPVGVIDPWVEAGGPLVAPEGVAAVGHDVGKCAVKELEQLIPLSGVVEPSHVTPEPNGIVNDILCGEREREVFRPQSSYSWL